MKLYQNHPNPFRESTIIEFFLYDGGFITLAIYNDKGQETCKLVNKYKSSGEHRITWNGNSYPSGNYFAVLTTRSQNLTIKMKKIR